MDASGNMQYGVLTRNIMDFESLYFNITRADNRITIDELKKKSVFDFYNYKKMLQQSLKT